MAVVAYRWDNRYGVTDEIDGRNRKAEERRKGKRQGERGVNKLNPCTIIPIFSLYPYILPYR